MPKFLLFLLLFFPGLISARSTKDPSADTSLRPAWIKRFEPNMIGQDYYIIETWSGHFGFVNKKMRLVGDTVYRNYCSDEQYLPDNKRFYFMQKCREGKTIYDFDGDWIMTDNKGKPLNKMVFFRPYSFSRNFDFYTGSIYMCNGNGKWGKLNQDMKWEIEPRYDSLWCFFWDTLGTRASFIVKENGLYGILDSDKIVVPCQYNRAMYGFGGTSLILANEKDTVVYSVFVKKLMSYDSLFKAIYDSNWLGYYYNYNYLQHQEKLTAASIQKYKRSAFLMEKSIYDYRFSHREAVSPQLYYPGMRYGNEVIQNHGEEDYKSRLCFPYYSPPAPYLPWLHLLTAYSDSALFSYATNYSMIDTYANGPPVSYSSHYPMVYSFHDQDSNRYVNCAVTADRCYTITLDSILRNDVQTEEGLRKLLRENFSKRKELLPPGTWTLYDQFLIMGTGMEIMFRCNENDVKGNTQIAAIFLSWEELSPFLNPNGLLGNRIVKTPAAKPKTNSR